MNLSCDLNLCQYDCLYTRDIHKEQSMEQNTSRNSVWMALLLVLMLALASGVSANKAAQSEPRGTITQAATQSQF